MLVYNNMESSMINQLIKHKTFARKLDFSMFCHYSAVGKSPE